MALFAADCEQPATPRARVFELGNPLTAALDDWLSLQIWPNTVTAVASSCQSGAGANGWARKNAFKFLNG